MTPRSSHRPPWTRRAFVQAGVHTGAAAVLGAVLPARGVATHQMLVPTHRPAEYLADPERVRALAFRAIDAAKSAGATYADARVTRIVSQSYTGAGLTFDIEDLGLGVRTLVDRAWGFAASPYWDLNDAAQLARDAVAQATANARYNTRPVELGQYPVATGSWTTPIRIDPFTIPMEEKTDFVDSFRELAPRHITYREIGAGLFSMGFVREERAVATTEGAYFTQTLYRSGGTFAVRVQELNNSRLPTDRYAAASGRGINTAGAGWERLLDAKLREQIPGLIDEAEALMLMAHKPVEIGRYQVVCDAAAMANLVSGTLGEATQLDRALGYEANAGGTSYLGPDPMKALGTTLGSTLFTVTANRSAPGGLATVQWDEEGVRPETFTLVQQGVFVDYQTTREQAAWLATYYQTKGLPVRSHGCSMTRSALAIPMQGTPNLALTPGTTEAGFEDLVATVKRGLAVMGGGAQMDFQSRTGLFVPGMVREIIDGRLGAIVDGAAISFNSTQLWKNLQAIGGPGSVAVGEGRQVKGQPTQSSFYSVAAVPAVFKELAVIDPRRRA